MSRLAGASPPAASLRGLDADKWQRGHVGPPVAALGGNPTSPLDPVRGTVGPVSGHGGVPPCPGSTKLSRGVRGSCGIGPLRQSYITPHCPQCPPVSRRLLLWQPPLGALRVKATGRYAKLPSLDTVTQPSALPGRIRALRAAVWLPCGGCGTVASVRRFAQRFGQWPAAIHVVCAPPTLWASPLRGIGPALVCPSAPKGLPQPRALVVGFCYRFCSWSLTENGGYRPKRPVSQRDRWLTSQVQWWLGLLCI